MREDVFQELVATKAALDAVEQAHPDSRAVKALHARLGRILDRFSHLVDEDEYVALGGGTPKEGG